MSNDTRSPAHDVVPEADVAQARISIVWLLPAIAVLLGGWLLFKSIRDRGISVTVRFETASGLEAGKTAVRYRDVQVGLVNAIRVGTERDDVAVEIEIQRDAKDMLVADTEFWVVRPRATLQGVSGLSTLLSGAYIAIQPGKGDTPSGDLVYTGLEQPPVLDADTPGARFVLKAESLGSISVESPVYFRGMNVGEVTKSTLDADAQGVTINVFVEDPHHKLVLGSSRFWNASGFHVRAGASGLEVNTESLESLLIGGIAFDSPREAKGATSAADGTTFKLYAEHGDIKLDDAGGTEFVCYFEDSLRGLNVAAPVEFNGLVVGHVKAIDVFRETDGTVRMPVTISVQLGRLGVPTDSDIPSALSTAMKKHGLRARLDSGSLLTGALFVNLVTDTTAAERLVASKASTLPQVATVSSGLAAIEKSIESAVRKLDAILTTVEGLPLTDLVQNASDAAASIERLASSPDLERAIWSAGEAIDTLEPTLKELQSVVRNVDSGVQTMVGEAKATAEQLRETLARAEKTLTAMDQSVGPDSAAQADLARALTEMGRAARSLRELSSYLERHPEALLRGKSDTGGR